MKIKFLNCERMEAHVYRGMLWWKRRATVYYGTAAGDPFTRWRFVVNEKEIPRTLAEEIEHAKLLENEQSPWVLVSEVEP